MPSDAYRERVDQMMALAPPRVWSLIITVFGDLAREEGRWIDGPTLTALLSELHVRPDAVRVALHRLRSDGWIISEKSGRTSKHSLSAKARSESNRAADRIYANPTKDALNWHLILTEEPISAPDGYMPVAPRVHIGGRQSIPPPEAVLLAPQNMPNWVQGHVAPAELLDGYAALFNALVPLQTFLTSNPMLTDLQNATLRCVTVHAWRRLVLRHPDLPTKLFPVTWRGQDCAHLVAKILDHLPKPHLG